MAMKKKQNLPGEGAELLGQTDPQFIQRNEKETSPPVKANMQRLLQELQVLQTKLKIQNEELLQARSEAKAGLERYAALYDFAPLGYFSLDCEGTILSVNLAGSQILGIKPHQLIKRCFSLFVSAETRPIYTAFIDKVFKSNIKESCEITLDGEKNSLRFVRIEAAVSKNGQECYAAVMDITEQKQAEEEIQLYAAHVESLVNSAARLNASLDMESVVNGICEETIHALHVPAACIYLNDESHNDLELVASNGLPPGFNRRLQAFPHILLDRVRCQPGAAGIISDIQSICRKKDLPAFTEQNVRTAMAAGIFHNQVPIGLLCVFTHGELHYLTSYNLFLLRGLAEQSTQAIVNARLFKQVVAGQKRMRALSKKLVEIQEIERRALALELHDELGQLLSSTKMSLDLIPSLPETAAREQLKRAQSLLNDLVSRVRRMALHLRPSMLDDMGLVPAVNWLFKDYQAETGEPVVFKQTLGELRFSPQVEITAYRIIQEALTNVIRHARNKQVYIHAWIDTQSLHLQIVDNGVGFDPQKVFTEHVSSGLSGMRERVQQLGGELLIESSPGTGTVLTAHLPVKPVMEDL
jgi:PAS domain S-box-containing protein